MARLRARRPPRGRPTLGVAQCRLRLVRLLRARLLIGRIFVASIVLAGFNATLGIVKLTTPSETWRLVFAVVGAIAVGVTAFLRLTGWAGDDPVGGNLPRA